MTTRVLAGAAVFAIATTPFVARAQRRAESRDAPSRGAAHWRLGMIYERLERVADARAEYDAAVALEPTNAGIRRSRDHLSK